MTNKRSTAFSHDIDDFGFSFVDGQDIASQAVEPYAETVGSLTERLQQMYDAIIPLLVNLKANPHQDYIKWPHRQKRIDTFKQKLDDIGGSYITRKDV